MKNIGPNDFLSIVQVNKQTDGYIKAHKDDLLRIGAKVRDQMNIEAQDPGSLKSY